MRRGLTAWQRALLWSVVLVITVAVGRQLSPPVDAPAAGATDSHTQPLPRDHAVDTAPHGERPHARDAARDGDSFGAGTSAVPQTNPGHDRAAEGRAWAGADTRGAAKVPSASIQVPELPTQARATLQRIRSGGPFAHRQDGSVFGNREGRLPPQPRGWYREYTVETPGAGDRGARRIVTGGDPPVAFFYTDDHYRRFRQIIMDGAAQ